MRILNNKCCWLYNNILFPIQFDFGISSVNFLSLKNKIQKKTIQHWNNNSLQHHWYYDINNPSRYWVIESVLTKYRNKKSSCNNMRVQGINCGSLREAKKSFVREKIAKLKQTNKQTLSLTLLILQQKFLEVSQSNLILDCRVTIFWVSK